nr:hypothetical protein [uncultured Pseudomonas sp.]
MSLVHHYTTENHHLPLILSSGLLLPSNAGAEHEEPLLWFSRNQVWEKTATKMVSVGGGIRSLTFNEQLAKWGCVRFSLPADDSRIMNWADACKHAGITRTVRRQLEAVGKKRGGSPSDWCAVAVSIPLSDSSLTRQRFDGKHWTEFA